MHLALKAWFEVVGVLASILDLIEKKYAGDEFMEKFKPYALGNKAKGAFKVGDVEVKSVAAMIEKADKYLAKYTKQIEGAEVVENYFTDFYDTASSASHPCFDSYEYIGGLKENSWHAFSPDEFKKQVVTNRPSYGGLLLSPLCIYDICKKIFSKCECDFSKINAIKLFDSI